MDNGVEATANQTEGVQAPSSPSAPSPEAGSQQQASPAQTGVNQQPTAPVQPDWRQSPEFRGVTKENRRFKQENESFKREIAELRGQIQGVTQYSQRSNQTQISQEDESALERIFTLASESPRVMKIMNEKFGMGKISALEKGLSDLSQSWNSSQADSERSSILAHAKSIGLDENEVNDAIDQQIENHPIYSQIDYKPGALKSVYRDLFFDRAKEIGERASNIETIKKREALKNGQSQQPGSRSSNGTGMTADQKFQKAINDAGGVDFTR